MVKRIIDSAPNALKRIKAEKKRNKKQSDGSQAFSADVTLKILRKLESRQVERQQENNGFGFITSLGAIPAPEVKNSINESNAQNETLREANRALSESLKKYTSLYDSAPAALFTLGKAGDITNLNLAAARMLGKERSQLINCNFNLFVGDGSKADFHNFLNNAFETRISQSVTVKLHTHSVTAVDFLMEGVVSGNVNECHLTVSDATGLSKLKEAANELEERYYSIIDNILDVYYETSLDGIILELSPSINIISKGQLQREELIGRSILELYAFPLDRDLLLKELIENGSVTDFEMYFRNTDGEIVPCALSSTFKYNSQGSIDKIVGTIRDTRKRKKTEELLRESEVHFRTLADSGQSLVWLSDIEKNIYYFNKPWFGFTGQTPGMQPDKDWIESLHPDDKDRVMEVFFRESDKQHKFSIEFRVLHFSGEYHWVLNDASPRYNSKGEFIGYIGHGLDINDLKLSEKALIDSELRFSQVTAGSGIWVWEVDETGLITYVSGAAETLLGYKPEELLGKKYFYDFFDPSVKEELRNAAFNVFKNKETFNNFINPNVHKKGHTVILETSGVPFLDKHGNLIGYRGTDKDITRRFRAEEDLKNSEFKFRNLFETMSQGVIYQDTSGKIISANPSALRILGLREEDVIHKYTFDPGGNAICEDGSLVGSENHPSLLALQTGVGSEAVMGVLNPVKGYYNWVKVNATPEFMPGETKPFRVFTTFDDISQLKESLYELSIVNQSLEVRVEQRAREIRQFANMQKAILDHAGLSIISTSADGVVQTFNAAAEKTLGYAAAEVVGKVTADLFHDKDELQKYASGLSEKRGYTFPPDFSIITEIHKLHQSHTLDWNFRHKNGTAFPVKLTVSSIEDEDGAVSGYIGVAMDIAVEKKAIESLRLSEERFHAMFHNHAAVMFLVNPATGYIIEANQAAAAFYGYNFEGDEKVHINEINILSREELAREMKEAVLQDRNYFIYNHKLASGEIRIVEVHSSPIDVEGDKLLFSIIHDITDRREAEELLRRSEAENRAILTAVPDFLFRLDKDGVFLAFHTGNSDSLLVEPNLFLGKNTRDILPAAIADKAMKALEQAFSTGETITFEYELPVNGSIHYYEDRVLAISDTEALAIIRDITPRIIAEKALQWNESLLKKMTESSPLAFLVVDNRTDEILYTNHRFFEIWGITHLEEQVQKRELKNNDIIPDCLPVLKDIPAFAASCAPLQATENREVLEDEIPFNDGRTIRRFSSQLRDDEDQYHGRLYIFEDISERKNTEQFLSIQRDLAIELSACSDLSVALSLSVNSLLKLHTVDAIGIYLLDNADSEFKLTAHVGLSPQFIETLSTVSSNSEIGKMVLQGNPIFGSYEQIVTNNFPWMNGSEFTLLGIIPVRFEGRVIGTFNIGSKSVNGFNKNNIVSIESIALQVGGAISRINAVKALISSQLNFRTLFDTIDDFLFILDTDGKIMMTNPVVQKRLGYTSAELHKLYVFNVHPPEMKDDAWFAFNEIIAGRVSYYSIPLLTREGNHIPVETRIIAGRWDNKDVLYGISRDITELRKAEKDIQLRESYLSAVINNHPGMFWMKDLNGKYLIVNEQNDNLLRLFTTLPGDTILGITDFDIFPQEEAQRYLDEDLQVIDWRLPLIIEEQKVVDNQLIWFEKSKFPVVDKQNEIIGVSAYAINITERKKTEVALKMQSAAFESFAFAIIITDIRGIILWANSSFANISGYSLSEVIGKSSGEMLQSGLQDKAYYDKLWSSVLSGKIWTGELINKRKDGQLYAEEQTITPVLDQNGDVSHFIAIKIDITSRKEMEKALRESEARWNFALEGSGDGVWDWNALTDEVFFSKQWKNMFGYSDAEIGNTLNEWDIRVHPDDKARCYADLEKHFTGFTEIYMNEHRVLCKDGSYKWIFDRGKVVSWQPDGRPLRVIGTHTDISGRKKTEQSLLATIEKEKELNELKSKFISVASHEFRTPLSTILASSESLGSYWDRMTAEQRELRFSKIRQQVEHLNKYIGEMLHLTRLQAKEYLLEPVKFDMVELFHTIIEEFRNIESENDRIDFNHPAGQLNVSLDKNEISKMISNLITNALKYSEKGMLISVKLNSDNNSVYFSVKDKGIGIGKADMKHVFEPFFRASNTGNIPGTGLGLNIVKEAIDRHKGTLNVKSKLNAGSEFIVQLPLSISRDTKKMD